MNNLVLTPHPPLLLSKLYPIKMDQHGRTTQRVQSSKEAKKILQLATKLQPSMHVGFWTRQLASKHRRPFGF